jgi:peptidoglycan hydrolase CwlO-like protein
MEALLSFIFSTEGFDSVTKLVGVSVLLLFIIIYLVVMMKEKLFETGVKQNVVEMLLKQIEDVKKDFENERDKLEEAYKERNEAISEVKKWQSLAQRLERDVEEMREEIKQSSLFIRSLLNNIHKFTQEHPDKAQYLDVPDFPNKD